MKVDADGLVGRRAGWRTVPRILHLAEWTGSYLVGRKTDSLVGRKAR